MNRYEAKTGQRIDISKHGLVHPVLVDHIMQIPGLPTNLSVIDFGSGDATSSLDVLKILIGSGKKIDNLSLVDADTGIFPDLIGTVALEPVVTFNTQVVQARKTSAMEEFLNHHAEKHDLALSQLVLHQISNGDEASYLMYLAYQALKPTGDLFVVNLHPRYLQYLAENEPNKFVVTHKTDSIITGTYKFDSSGGAQVYSRNIENQLAMFLGLGFDFVKLVPTTTERIADLKPRYRDLSEKGIPMFYLMQLKKNPSNFVSSTKGTVKQIKSCDHQWITVTFLDDQEIKIPSFCDWAKVEPGSSLVLLETTRKEIEATLLNYWVIDSNEEIWGGQLVCRKQL